MSFRSQAGRTWKALTKASQVSHELLPFPYTWRIPRHETERKLRQMGPGSGLAARFLVMNNLRLLVTSAMRTKTVRGWDKGDAVQDGYFGLHHAAEVYDINIDRHFGGWAHPIVILTMHRARYDWLKHSGIRAYLQQHQLLPKVRKYIRCFPHQHERRATAEDVAAAFPVNIWDARRLVEKRVYATTRKQQKRRLGRMPDRAMSTAEEVEATDFQKFARTRAHQWLEWLDPRSACVLCLRFGFTGGHEHTLEEIGKSFGLTRERVRQIEARALRRLARKFGTDAVAKRIFGP